VDIICPQQRPQMATVKPGVFVVPNVKKDTKGQVVRVAAAARRQAFSGAGRWRPRKKRSASFPSKKPKSSWPPAGGSMPGQHGPGAGARRCARGAVAGTRPLMDKGWITPDCMIGRAGKSSARTCSSAWELPGPCISPRGSRGEVRSGRRSESQAPIFPGGRCGLSLVTSGGLPPLIHELRKLKPADASRRNQRAVSGTFQLDCVFAATALPSEIS